MRIGLFGGTFNPIHNGHINLAKSAVKLLCLGRVIFIPAYMPPHKRVAGGASPRDRVNMVKAAVKNNKKFEISLYEILRRRKTYSVTTLAHFRKKFGKSAKLFFLAGADFIRDMHTWKNIEKAFSLAEFAVFSRPGYRLRTLRGRVKALNMPAMDISSSQIRALVKKGRPLSGIVPQSAERYIKRKNLYR